MIIDLTKFLNLKNKYQVTTFTTALHVAVESDDIDYVSYLLKNKSDVNAMDSYGFTPLHVAAVKRNRKICELLLQSEGIDVNVKNCHGKTALQIVLEDDVYDFDLTQIFVEPETIVRNQLLHSSVIKNDINTVTALLDCGADVNCISDYNRTPIYHLMYGYNCWDDETSMKIIELLIERKADLNTMDVNGFTPFTAFLMSKADAETTRMLIERGADVFLRNQSGETALHRAVYNTVDPIGVANVLLNHGLEIDCKDSKLRTPFFTAVRGMDDPIMLNIVKFLMGKGANVQTVDVYGNTALMSLIREINLYAEQSSEDYDYDEDTPCDLMEEDLIFLMRFIDVNVINNFKEHVLSRDLPNWAWKVIIRNLVIMMQAGQRVRLEISHTIFENYEMTDYFYLCKEELMRLKNTVYYGSTTYFDLLLHHDAEHISCHSKIWFCKNRKELADDNAKSEYEEIFPIYADHLNYNFEEVKKVTESYKKRILDYYFSNMHMPFR